MKYLAIDYGKKYIGLAVSDDSGIMAFPLDVFKNDSKIVSTIQKICKDKNIGQIIIGDSVDQNGQKNRIAQDAEKFAKIIKEKISLGVVFEKEQFTSSHARHGGGEMQGRIDASAGALILQRFLDRINK